MIANYPPKMTAGKIFELSFATFGRVSISIYNKYFYKKEKRTKQKKLFLRLFWNDFSIDKKKKKKIEQKKKKNKNCRS